MLRHRHNGKPDKARPRRSSSGRARPGKAGISLSAVARGALARKVKWREREGRSMRTYIVYKRNCTQSLGLLTGKRRTHTKEEEHDHDSLQMDHW